MNKTEKIMGMLTLLELNDDQFCYEMTSLAQKINNFFNDRSRLLSAQWLSVMYKSLTEDNDIETVEINDYMSVEIDTYERVGIDTNEYIVTDTDDVLNEASPAFDDSRFALV